MTQAANLAALGTNAGTTGILPAAGGGTGTTAGVTGFKNRIINGGMVVNQYQAGTVSPTSGASFIVDRFWAQQSGTPTITVQQSSTAPAGFTNSLLATVTSSGTPSGTNYYDICQRIEGYNIADLGWGTANAKAVTLSFWVNSSLIGTYSLTLGNVGSGSGRWYVTTYTVSAANTWQQITLNILGDTTGTWNSTNSLGIGIVWGLGSGSTYATTPTSAWQTGTTYLFASGVTNFVGNNGATFYITGVQLEVGSTATSFDVRSYGTELGLCQRYYAFGGNSFFGSYGGSSSGVIMLFYKVSMRATPTITSTLAGSSGSGVSTEVGNIYIPTNSTSPTTWTASAEL